MASCAWWRIMSGAEEREEMGKEGETREQYVQGGLQNNQKHGGRFPTLATCRPRWSPGWTKQLGQSGFGPK